MSYARENTVTEPTLGQAMLTHGHRPQASSSAVTPFKPVFCGSTRAENVHPVVVVPAQMRVTGSPTQAPPENPQAPASEPPVHPKVTVEPGVHV